MQSFRKRITDILAKTTCSWCSYEESNGELIRHCLTCASKVVDRICKELNRSPR